jgi:cobalt-zinc-cadmium efflux system membrane fusion protein
MKRDNRLIYTVALAVILAGVGGFGLAKCTASKPAPTASAEHEEEAAHLDGIKVTPQAIQSAGIGVTTVSAGGLSSEILAQGTVVATPSGQAILTARAAGAVTRIFKRLGDPVKAGETIALIESRDAGQISADRASAKARANLAQLNLAREKSLYEQKVSPRIDYEQAQAEASAAQAELRRTDAAAGAARVTGDGQSVAVASPIAGRVTASTVTLGAFVQPETELFRVSDPNLIQVEAAVGAAEAQRIASGDRVLIETAAGGTIEARVRSVTPALNAETRAATAVIDVNAAELTPGLSLRVRIMPSQASTSGAIVVPDEAVQSVNGQQVVFVRTSDGFRPQAVTVGQSSAGRVEVMTGLSAGQSIATRNAFVLKAELGKGEGEEH